MWDYSAQKFYRFGGVGWFSANTTVHMLISICGCVAGINSVAIELFGPD